MRLKSTLAAVAALCTVVIAGCGGSSAQPAATQGEVLLGVPIGTTGANATIGIEGLKGMQMAVDDINAKGGVNGKALKLAQIDDAGSAATASTNTRSLVTNQKVVALFGSSTSSTAAATEAIAGQYQIPFVIWAGADIGLTTKTFNKFTFQTKPSTYMEPRAVAQYMATQPYKRYYTVGVDISYGHNQVDTFLSSLKADGVTPQVVGQQWPAIGTSDYTSIITAIAAAKPEFVFTALTGSDLLNFLKQAGAYKLFQTAKLGVTTGSDLSLALGTSTPPGTVMWDSAPFFLMDQTAKDFADKFHSKFGTWPMEWPLMGYAAVQIWAQAAAAAKSFDGTQVAKAMVAKPFSTVRGQLSFRACDDQALVPTYLWVTASSADPKYGFPLASTSEVITNDKNMMPCSDAQALQPK